MVAENIDLVAQLTIADSINTYIPIVSKDNRYLLCCCGCNVKVYSILTGKVVHVLKGHSDLVTSIAFNPSNQFQVISCSADGTLRKWNFEDGVSINVTTPVCADDKHCTAIHRIIPLPGDKSHFLYLMSSSRNSTRHAAGSYKLMKQSVMMERWSSADLVVKDMHHLPSHLSIGGQGSFLASLTTVKKFSVTKLSGGGKTYWHWVKEDDSQVEVQQCLAKLKCLAAHPTEDCVAVGHTDGKISIWSNVLSNKAVYTWIHWHSLPVLSLSYTPEGSFLLSGGHESVLVKWPHGSYGNKSQREFLPRLGASVSHITTSLDNSLYITSHLDNSVKVIRNWIVVQVFQGLTRDYLSQDNCIYPAGVNFDPQSDALVINGLPGHIQFFSLEQDSLLYNLDIVAQNYFSGESLSRQSNYTRIERICFSPAGNWMVSLERWTGSYSEQCRMKFWYLDTDSKSYVLNTDVDTPHQGAVSYIAFAPMSDEGNGALPMLVSVGQDDKKFKLWTLEEVSADKGCWRVDSTGYYKDRPCSAASFSDDGSLLAVAFGDTLTLWDPLENYLCTTLDQGAKVTALQFCHGTEANYIAVTTSAAIIIWDLLDYSEKQAWPISNCNVLAVDPRGTTIAAFSNKTGFLFNCSGEFHQCDLPLYAHHVASAAFATTKQSCPMTSLSSVKDRLYLSTVKGAILVVRDRDVSLHSDVTPSVEQAGHRLIASNYKKVTPLTNLLTAHLVQKEQSIQAVDSQKGLAAAKIVKQVGETSCIAMPSMSTLCRAFLSALLLDKDVKPSRDEADLSDAEMDVDHDSEGEEESDSEANSKKKLATEQKTPTAVGDRRPLKKSDIIKFSAWQKT
ncbi:WD repeat-containing protein 75-like isoform X1 [Watersipora subatra]|uniref:WD repeat-containing protein 75-like isoform X1 n=1 Tax=Watersipora subatra TaxID=2589382 RepID=UPI00355C91B4